MRINEYLRAALQSLKIAVIYKDLMTIKEYIRAVLQSLKDSGKV